MTELCRQREPAPKIWVKIFQLKEWLLQRLCGTNKGQKTLWLNWGRLARASGTEAGEAGRA